MVALDGIEIAIGKRHVEALHARSILESTGEDALVHFARNVAVESGEVAESALLTASEIYYPIQMLEDLINGTGGHITPEALLVEYRKPGEPPPAERLGKYLCRRREHVAGCRRCAQRSGPPKGPAS
jgi:hypothetical protein